MRLSFECKLPNGACGLTSPYINYAKFRLPSGSIVTVDRQETDYNMDEDTLSMEWCDCYLWEIDDINIFDKEYPLGEDAVSLFSQAGLLELSIEDDAPADWKVNVVSWSVS